MTRDEIVRKYKEYLFPSVSTYFSDPLVTDHASMQYLWDADGKQYLDFFGGIVTISAGHANPRITSKIKAQIDKLQHASPLFPNEAIVALAEKLAAVAARQLRRSACDEPLLLSLPVRQDLSGLWHCLRQRCGSSDSDHY